MKKIVFFIIFSLLLFSKDISLYEKIKSKNNEIIQSLIKIKFKLIEKSNNLLPNFLNFQKEESFFKYNISYDSTKNKIKNSVNVRLKLPTFETKSHIDTNSTSINRTHHYIIKLTVRPIIKLKPLTPYLKIKLLQKDNEIFSNLYTYSYYPVKKKWDFKDEYKVSVKKFSTTIYLHTSKEELDNIDYGLGIYYLIFKNEKKVFLTGYSNSGITSKKPTISSHKIQLSFRTHILNSKRTVFEATSYLKYEKENLNFTFKPGIYLSITYQI